jgi:2-dehydropantoate 2-reductase
MNIVIIGAGGVGSYFGAKLIEAGHDVVLVARGAHLHAMQNNGLHVNHSTLQFSKRVQACDMQTFLQTKPLAYDLLILLTKSMETATIAKQLSLWLDAHGANVYVLSLQNGVENEDILAEYLPKTSIIGGLTRKIGAHVVTAGHVEAVGIAETIFGSIVEDNHTHIFVQKLAETFNKAGLPTQITSDIRKELWKKLIINNGVNALCALLRVKTGVLMHHPKLSPIVLGLMHETARAARVLHVNISSEDVEAMFQLILGFDSIKPSMLVDLEHHRALELEEICGVVIRTLEKESLDAPYTRTIASLLEYTLEVKK